MEARRFREASCEEHSISIKKSVSLAREIINKAGGSEKGLDVQRMTGLLKELEVEDTDTLPISDPGFLQELDRILDEDTTSDCREGRLGLPEYSDSASSYEVYASAADVLAKVFKKTEQPATPDTLFKACLAVTVMKVAREIIEGNRNAMKAGQTMYSLMKVRFVHEDVQNLVELADRMLDSASWSGDTLALYLARLFLLLSAQKRT